MRFKIKFMKVSYLKGQNGGETVQIDFENQDHGIGGSSVTLTTEWQRFSAVFTSDATATRGLQLRLIGSVTNQDFTSLCTSRSHFWNNQLTTTKPLEQPTSTLRFDYSAETETKRIPIGEARTNLFNIPIYLTLSWTWDFAAQMKCDPDPTGGTSWLKLLQTLLVFFSVPTTSVGKSLYSFM